MRWRTTAPPFLVATWHAVPRDAMVSKGGVPVSVPISHAEDLAMEFGGHESFPFRYGWLKKAVDVLQEKPEVFFEDNAIILFGVGKNMVRSIRHWGVATTVLDEVPNDSDSRRRIKVVASEFGKRLLDDNGWDPYLEDPASLWLLHWLLLSNYRAKATTWYLAFNLLHTAEFTKQQLQELVHENLVYRGHDRSPNTIRRDVNCFVQTYNAAPSDEDDIVASQYRCPLTELGLVREMENGQLYRFVVGAKPSLPPEIVGFALLTYMQVQDTDQRTLSVEKCLWAEGSPGQAFKLDEESLMRYLAELEEITQGAIGTTDTAGLKQVYFGRSWDANDFLRGYYNG